MKLHATITNENGTTVSKGGQEKLTIGLNRKNKNVVTIDFDGDILKVYHNGGHYWSTEIEKGEKQKGKCEITGCHNPQVEHRGHKSAYCAKHYEERARQEGYL